MEGRITLTTCRRLLLVTKPFYASSASYIATAACFAPSKTQHRCVLPPRVTVWRYGHEQLPKSMGRSETVHHGQMRTLMHSACHHRLIEPHVVQLTCVDRYSVHFCVECLLSKTLQCGSIVMTVRRGMAGHSKWANIRHIKAAKDAAKAKIANEIATKARSIIKETGNPDPKSNLRLARVVEEAKSKDVPNATIEKILSQANKMKDAAPVLFEAKGPGGSVMLIEAMAAKRQQTKSELQSMVKKCGFSMFEGGSLAKMCFEEKGVVLVDTDTTEGKEVDMDKFVEIAIEAGAEEVTLEEENGDQVLQFLCEPDDVYNVKKELEARELPVRSAEVTFLTTNSVPFTPEAIEMLGKVLDKLDEHPDVVKVHTNVTEASA